MTDFVWWLTNGDISEFYGPLRWPRWEINVAELPAGQGWNFWPPLWSKEGSAETSSRKAVPIEELWGLGFEYQKQLAR